MSSEPQLRKPTFVKVRDLEKVRSGYNVYVKVVSADVRDIETRTGQKIRMVDAVVGDETGVAKAFFKGENATLIEKGAVIAIRNGLKKFIKNFISLELDIFGRVTKETVDIAVDQSYNISEQEHKLPERQRGQRNFSQGRRPNNNRRPNNRRQYNNDRPPRRFNEDRAPREERGPRQNRGPREERGPRQDRGPREDRPQRRYDDRPRRQEDNREGRQDRRPQYNDRPPRRDNYDRDFDRRQPQTQGNDRPPRRQQRYEPRREEFRERRPIQWTKIDEISPGDDRINIIVKVISEELVQGKRAMLRCTLGDDTGLVRAFLPDEPALRVGKSVVLFDCEARVVKEHIEVQLGRSGRIDVARKEVDRVNEKFNLSDKSWVPVQQ